MKMKIHIHNLCFEAIIGILPEERVKPQRVIIHATLHYEYSNEVGYIDYAAVAQYIMACVQDNQYGLLEVALNDIGSKCLAKFQSIQKLKLTLEKPDILPHCNVGVEGTFRRDT